MPDVLKGISFLNSSHRSQMALTTAKPRMQSLHAADRWKGSTPLLPIPMLQITKRGFGGTQVRYRGLYKTTYRLDATCALVNLFLVRKRWLQSALAIE